jgi:hypothetical protein
LCTAVALPGTAPALRFLPTCRTTLALSREIFANASALIAAATILQPLGASTRIPRASGESIAAELVPSGSCYFPMSGATDLPIGRHRNSAHCLPTNEEHRVCPSCASDRTGPAEHVIVSGGVVVREEHPCAVCRRRVLGSCAKHLNTARLLLPHAPPPSRYRAKAVRGERRASRSSTRRAARALPDPRGAVWCAPLKEALRRSEWVKTRGE